MARTLSVNRRARHDYHIEESYEAGIALLGTEVKSIRLGRANLKDSYASIEGGELFLHKCHISPYEAASRFNHDPLRPRKLLLHRREIHRLMGRVQEKGYTLIPLSLYAKEGKIKVALGLCRGKKLFDKREDLKRREAEREVERALRARGRQG